MPQSTEKSLLHSQPLRAFPSASPCSSAWCHGELLPHARAGLALFEKLLLLYIYIFFKRVVFLFLSFFFSFFFSPLFQNELLCKCQVLMPKGRVNKEE